MIGLVVFAIIYKICSINWLVYERFIFPIIKSFVFGWLGVLKNSSDCYGSKCNVHIVLNAISKVLFSKLRCIDWWQAVESIIVLLLSYLCVVLHISESERLERKIVFIVIVALIKSFIYILILLLFRERKEMLIFYSQYTRGNSPCAIFFKTYEANIVKARRLAHIFASCFCFICERIVCNYIKSNILFSFIEVYETLFLLWSEHIVSYYKSTVSATRKIVRILLICFI